LTFTLQYDYLKSDGFNDFDFTSGVLSASGIPDGLPVDIPDWDDYTKSSFTLTAVYNWSGKRNAYNLFTLLSFSHYWIVG